VGSFIRSSPIGISACAASKTKGFSFSYFYQTYSSYKYSLKKKINFTNNFINAYYKHLYITTQYYEINKKLIALKNKINYKRNLSIVKKQLLNKKLKKKNLIYYLVNIKKDIYSFYYNISINIVTKKKNRMTFIRSPFIYKKSREQFIRSYVMYLFKLEKLNFKNFYKITRKLELMFIKKISGSFLKYYFNTKYNKN
jgi:ribosomal protein S10